MKTRKITYLNRVLILFLFLDFSVDLLAKPLEFNLGLEQNVNGNLAYITTVFNTENDLEILDVPMPLPPGDCSDLFISEYIEGSSSNKAIEIYNPTSDPIDLSNYSIRYYNGSSTSVSGTYSSWSGTIPAKGTIVVRNNNASISGITSVANFTTTSSALNYNGNDAVSLYKESTMIDIIGPIGSSSNFAKDRTMVRKSTIGQGQTTYNAADWDENSQNFTDSLGGHYSSVCTVVLPPSCDTDTTFNHVGCDSLTLGDSTYFTSTTLYDTILNAAACDSVMITEIEVGTSYNLSLEEQFGIDSVVVNGTSYYTTQTVNLTLATTLGCDSLVQVPIQILNSSDIDTLGFQSFGSDADQWAYTLNQPTYNSNGDIWEDIESFFSVNATEGDYFWGMRDLTNGINVTDLHTISFDPIEVTDYVSLSFTFDYYSSLVGGSDFVDYIVEFDNGNTWGSSTSLNNNSDAWITEEITIPEGTEFVRLQLRGDFNGGSDYAGFDNVLLYGISTPETCSAVDTVLQIETCESYIHGDSTYTASTQIIDSLTQVGNTCDSVVTINLTVNQPALFTDIQNACDEYTWINGVTYSASNNIAKDTLVAVNGCDSIVTLDLTITNSVTEIDVQNACDEYTWINGVTYSTSNNTAKDTLVAINGCDSIVTLDLTITNSVTGIDVQNACEAYTWIDGVTYSVSNNTAKDTLVATNGCDSIVTLDLTITNSVTGIDVQNACEPYTWINGVTYSSSNNTAKDTLVAISGCDSIVTLNLTVNSPVNVIDIQEACDEYTWINGETYSASNNTAKDTLVALNGCDSIITLDLTITNSVTGIDVQSTCDTYTWINGITYTESNNTAKDTLVASNGCDSIVTLNLTINHTMVYTDIQVTCEEFTWIDGITYTESINGVKDTLVALNGCDSIVTLDLTINNSVETTDIQNACMPYTWINGVTYSESNHTAKDTLETINGCDSIVTLDLTISTTLSGIDVQNACEEFTWINGVTYTESNTSAIDTISGVGGCDSIVTLNLTILEPTYGTETVTTFGTFTWINGITYTESTNSVIDTILNTQGCDSIITLELTILQEYCGLRSTRNRYEWIKQVELENDINNITSAESGGYGYYSTDTLFVDTNAIVNVALTPGYKRRAYNEYWRIWVDWNYDGDFNDLGEKVFEQKGKNLQTGSFQVPVNVSANALRVRVAMRWKRYAPNCGRYSNGEVEDYIMRVNGAQGALDLDADGKLFFEQESTEALYEFAELYPNPVFEGGIISGYVRVETPGLKTLQITNTLGQVIRTLSIDCYEEETRFEIPTNGLVKGMYFMTIDKGQETTKIIVQ